MGQACNCGFKTVAGIPVRKSVEGALFQPGFDPPGAQVGMVTARMVRLGKRLIHQNLAGEHFDHCLAERFAFILGPGYWTNPTQSTIE